MKNLIVALIRWVYWCLFGRIIQKLPFYLVNKFSYLFTPAYYFVAKNKRNKIRQGLVKMYGGKISRKELKKIVYKTLANDVESAIEHLLYPRFDADYCKKNIKYRGLEHVEKALAEGKGVVLLHCHMGNPHMIMPSMGHMGYKLHQLASRVLPEKDVNMAKEPGILGELVNMLRLKCYDRITFLKEKLPVNFVYTDNFLRAPFKILKKNEILAMALDGREGSKSIDTRFLNQTAIFYTGAMRVILIAKPVVLPVFHVRNKPDTHTIIIEEPFEIEISENNKADVERNIKRFVKIMECYIHKYPWLYSEAFALKDPFFKN